MSLYAGIDLGGTKIHTSVFDDQWMIIDSKRTATPKDDYQQFLEALQSHISWVDEKEPSNKTPIGVGVPGVIDPHSGLLRAANLCANGQNISTDLYVQTQRQVSIVNDCKAFALSEACLGNGSDFNSVLGISLGTGIAGGLVTKKHLLPDANAMAGEFGHISLPVTTAFDHKLPILDCGCGRRGCYETFVCGPGFERLGAHQTNEISPEPVTVKQWVKRYHQEDADAIKLLDTWFAILADMINDLTLCYDPDCIVFGGGMSNLPEFINKLEHALNNTVRLISRLPVLRIAAANEHSGARGAALYAAEALR